jgi:hypothetical protein
VLALVPVYLLQVCYGMNTGYPAILTPQLREKCSEFPITLDEESWIVSIDNLATPLVCILSGFLQQKFGPLRVKKILLIIERSDFWQKGDGNSSSKTSLESGGGPETKIRTSSNNQFFITAKIKHRFVKKDFFFFKYPSN